MQKLVNKAISPAEIVKALQAGSITIAQAQQLYNGTIVIGDFKGIAALLDLDAMVNQPLALVEELYALDKIDARDFVTITLPIGAIPASGILTAAFVVPSTGPWFLEQMAVACPVTAVAGETINVNVRLSTWQFPDTRLGTVINLLGRSYYAADLVATSAAAIATTTVLGLATELGRVLKLSGGDIITITAASSGAALTAAKIITLSVFGRKGLKLVD